MQPLATLRFCSNSNKETYASVLLGNVVNHKICVLAIIIAEN